MRVETWCVQNVLIIRIILDRRDNASSSKGSLFCWISIRTNFIVWTHNRKILNRQISKSFRIGKFRVDKNNDIFKLQEQIFDKQNRYISLYMRTFLGVYVWDRKKIYSYKLIHGTQRHTFHFGLCVCLVKINKECVFFHVCKFQF